MDTLEQLRDEQLRIALSQLLYTQLSETEMQLIRPILEWRLLEGGEVLFHKGDKADGAYIIVSGRVMVYDEVDGRKTELAVIGRGNTVGEIAVVTGEPRSASVMALRDSLLVRLSMISSGRIIQMYPRMVINISRSLISRLRGISRRRNAAPATIAVVALSPSINAENFSHHIGEYLSAHKQRIGYATSESVEQITERKGIAYAREDDADYDILNKVLDDLELKHDVLILVCHTEPNEWTKRCLRQADDIIVLIDSQLPAMREDLLGLIGDAEVRPVIIHPDSTSQPSGSADLLQPFNTARWHHIRMGVRSDLERLARHILGRSIGLVLSGGGARGLSHLGAYKALRELGVPIDLVGGSSSGALMSTHIARNWDVDTILRRARATAMSNPTNDYSVLPLVSLLNGKKFTRILDEYFTGMSIEDFWMPFFCVSSSITRAQEKIHTRGPIHTALRASIAIPAVYKPVIIDGEYHVDGGVMNNMPIDVMQSFGAGRTIAIELFSSQYAPDPSMKEIPTLWQYIRQKITGKIKDIPTPLATIIECTTLGSAYKSNEYASRVDLHIQNNMSAYGLMDWLKYDQLVEDGYRQTLQYFERPENNDVITRLLS